MIPLYILGLLLRFGPQHGYQIKKLIEEQLADFTQIKLPTIYYHLEKMEASKLIIAETDQEGTRPEKKVYHVEDKGLNEFNRLLNQQLTMGYRPTFDSDAVFYYSDHLEKDDIAKSLHLHIENLNGSLKRIEEHRKFALVHIQEDAKSSAEIIFDHHVKHFQAEIEWAQKAITTLEGASHD